RDLTVTGVQTCALPIFQIVTNLLHNAAKFSPTANQTHVRLTREGANAVVRVVDTGVGLPTDQLERVFEMFALVQRSSAPAETGRSEERRVGKGCGSRWA